ncbi:MAG TPA: Uma2 family endonuclease [Isosphaeraceae bacterium]|nr:Uma2 family endonuclease [Isosphaeraceae bacterium]
MSTVPAMPPIAADSIPPVSPPTALTPSIPEDMLYEVVDGRVLEKNMGSREIEIATILGGYLFQFARANRLGRALVECVFRIIVAEDMQRRPDVAFVSLARWPYNRRVPDVPVWDMVPDLAIEVISSSDMMSAVLRKVHDYFKAGVARVWVVYPEQAEVYIYSTPSQIEVVGIGQELDGGNLLPGFRLPVAVLFEDEPE